MCPQPRRHLVAQSNRQGTHRVGIGIGHEADAFVASDITLLSKGLERVHQRGVGANGLSQRLDESVVMLVPRSPVA